jgi:hypothetical protein
MQSTQAPGTDTMATGFVPDARGAAIFLSGHEFARRNAAAADHRRLTAG